MDKEAAYGELENVRAGASVGIRRKVVASEEGRETKHL